MEGRSPSKEIKSVAVRGFEYAVTDLGLVDKVFKGVGAVPPGMKQVFVTPALYFQGVGFRCQAYVAHNAFNFCGFEIPDNSFVRPICEKILGGQHDGDKSDCDGGDSRALSYGHRVICYSTASAARKRRRIAPGSYLGNRPRGSSNHRGSDPGR